MGSAKYRPYRRIASPASFRPSRDFAVPRSALRRPIPQRRGRPQSTSPVTITKSLIPCQSKGKTLSSLDRNVPMGSPVEMSPCTSRENRRCRGCGNVGMTAAAPCEAAAQRVSAVAAARAARGPPRGPGAPLAAPRPTLVAELSEMPPASSKGDTSSNALVNTSMTTLFWLRFSGASPSRHLTEYGIPTHRRVSERLRPVGQV